jgi:hypothetical protein
VALQSATTGVGVNIGFQKIFFNRGKTMFGVSLIIGAR